MPRVWLGQRRRLRSLSQQAHHRHDRGYLITKQLCIVTGQIERELPRLTRIAPDLIGPAQHADRRGARSLAGIALLVGVSTQGSELVLHHRLVEQEHHGVGRRGRIGSSAHHQELLGGGTQRAVHRADAGRVDQRHRTQRLVRQICVECGDLGQRHRQLGGKHTLRRQLHVELATVFEPHADALRLPVAKPRHRPRALADIGGSDPQSEQGVDQRRLARLHPPHNRHPKRLAQTRLEPVKLLSHLARNAAPHAAHQLRHALDHLARGHLASLRP